MTYILLIFFLINISLIKKAVLEQFLQQNRSESRDIFHADMLMLLKKLKLWMHAGFLAKEKLLLIFEVILNEIFRINS